MGRFGVLAGRSSRCRLLVVLMAVLAMVSPLGAVSSAQAAVKATLSLSPSTVIRGETVKVTGKLPGAVSRTVWVQRKYGTRWVTLVKAKTTRTGTYATSFKALAVGSYSVRTLAPRVTIARKVRAQYVTSAKILRVVAQTASLSMPTALVAAKTATAQLTFRPVRAGRAVALQVWRSGAWAAVATGRQSASGSASLTMRAGTPASYAYRAWTAARSGAPAFASPHRTLKVCAPPVVPAPDTTAPGPVTAPSVSAVTETSITLSWTNPTAADFTGVTIRRAVGATAPGSALSGTAVTVPASKTATSVTDPALTAGTQYSYSLFAHDGALNHAVATTLTAATPPPTTPPPTTPPPTTLPDITAPGPVTALTATAVSTTSIALAWTNPIAASLTGVMIRRQVGATAPASVSSGDLVTDEAKPSTSYTNTGLASGTQYSYALFAHNGTPMYAAAATADATTPGLPLSISGKVTDAAGAHNGLANAHGTVSANGQAVGFTTAADGSYTLSSYLSAGIDYKVCFSGSSATGGSSDARGYVKQCWQNQPSAATATPVAVTMGAATTGINAALVGAGTISGTVTDAAGTHHGLGNVYVWVTSPSTSSSGGATTATDGSYTVKGLAAATDYRVCFQGYEATGGSGDASGYFDQCWLNQPWSASDTPTPVAVTLGATTSGINAAFVGAGAISGTVTDAAGTHHGLKDVYVIGYSPSTGVNENTWTAADGSYTLDELPAGTDYTVCFTGGLSGATGATGGSSDAGGYLYQCWHNQPGPGTATPVAVTLGATRTGINASLTAGGGISGVVTDAGGTHHGLAGVNVQVSYPSMNYGVATAADGSWYLRGLPGRTDYRVCFTASGATGGSSDGTGYNGQCWQNKTASGTPTPVAVTLGAIKSGIDAALNAGGTISSTVTDAGGLHHGLANVSVGVSSPSTGAVGYATTAADGSYTATPLAAGTDYQVCPSTAPLSSPGCSGRPSHRLPDA